jgi:hypothetical protein
MKIIRNFCNLVLAVLVVSASSQAQQRGGEDYFHVKSARLAQREAFDFRLTTSYNATDEIFRIPTATDTITFRDGSVLADIGWSMRYGLNNNWEVGISGNAFLDKLTGAYRYGAGDTKLSIRYASPNAEEAQFNWASEAYYSFPVGFDEGQRLIRSFASDKGSVGANFYFDFDWSKWSAKVNAGYFHGNGRVKAITEPDSTYWYNVLNGVYGVTPTGDVIQSSQFNVGFGLGRNFIFGTKIFGEFSSNNMIAQFGDGRSVGNGAIGIKLVNKPGFQIDLGASIPLGSKRPNKGVFLDIRLNSFVGGRRRSPPPPPVNPLEEPALEPGRKPFIRRGGVLYSLPRPPIRDTVFIIDGTPSMIGRGIGEGLAGEEVLQGITEFVQVLIDSIPDRSNVSLISFNNEISTLSWQSLDAAKKEEVKNSVRDIPDEMNTKADELEAFGSTLRWRELLEAAILESYRQLNTFQRSDYNRQHLQRIIVFSDGIDESTLPHNLAPGFDSIQRRFELNREDFRFFYYVHTNPQTEGARVDDNIIGFSEREDGKVRRSVDINNVGEDLIAELNYNNVESGRAIQFLAQISNLAVLEFNTRNVGTIREPLVESFRSVFDYNEYFVLIPQRDVQAVMFNEGIKQNQKVVISDMVRMGRRLGVDYIVYGEIVRYTIERGRGLFIPYVIGFPRTLMEIEVAIQLVNVSDGTLAYVDNITASSGKSEGIKIFPRERENRMNQLSGNELSDLQRNLLLNWSAELRNSMFQDLNLPVE